MNNIRSAGKYLPDHLLRLLFLPIFQIKSGPFIVVISNIEIRKTLFKNFFFYYDLIYYLVNQEMLVI